MKTEIRIKTCYKCNIEKPLDCFSKMKLIKNELYYECKTCVSEIRKKYYNNRKEAHRKEAHRKEAEKYRKECSNCGEVKLLDCFSKNKTTIDGLCCYCKGCWKEYSKKYYNKNKNNLLKYKLNSNISTRISISLKGNKNGQHWETIVGWTLNDLKKHLKKLFYTDKNLTWDNYGSYWHIHHIHPISKFTFTSYDDFQFKKCWALKNLMPLNATENISKGNRIDKPYQLMIAV